MHCDDAQRLISDMQDGALSDRAERKVRRHMQACDACRAFDRRLAALQSVIGSMPLAPDDPARGDSYWDEMPGRIRGRLDDAARQATPGHSPGRLRVAGAALCTLLIAAICLAAYEHGRTQALRTRLGELHGRLPAYAHVPAAEAGPDVTLTPAGIGPRQRRLFHEMSLAFTDDLKWVATDGDRIDFGLSHSTGNGDVAVEKGRVVGVGLTVSRAGDARGAGGTGAMSIVAFEGCSAEFAGRQAGVQVRFGCTPRVGDDGRVDIDLRVALSDPSTGARCGLQTEANLARGSETEVGRIVLGSETFVVHACADVWDPDEGSQTGVARL
jgi:hypothetical protein